MAMVAAVFAARAEVPAAAYVQDGLIGHWDGIENVKAGAAHAAASATWCDISGCGKNWTLVANQYSWEANALYCNGAQYVGSISSAQKNIVTAEICFEDDDAEATQSYHVIWAGGQGRSNAGNTAYFTTLGTGSAKRITMCGKMGFSESLIVSGEPRTITAVYENLSGVAQYPRLGYVDGVVSNLVSGLGYNDAGMDSCTIGGRKSASDRNFKGRIYAIRFYNRELSAEEIAFNRRLDSSRFFADGHYGFKVESIADQTATGYEICPEPVVKLLDDTLLVKDRDYALSYTNNLMPGGALVFVTPIGAFAESQPHGADPFVTGFTIRTAYPIDASCYVTSDRISHFDAIENSGAGEPHNGGATVWTDLAGGEGYAINSSYGSWNNGKCLYCNGSGVAGSRTAAQLGVVTAEIALRHTDGITVWMSGQRTGGYSAQFAWWGNIMTLVRNDGIALTAGNDATLTAVYSLDGTGQYSASLDKVYRDGASTGKTKPQSSSYNDAGGANCTIGGRGAGSARNWRGNIYAIRLYSRELTAEEVRRNADVDRIRFFGAPVLTFGELQPQAYDGVHPCTPALRVTNMVTRAELIAGTDYRVVYHDNAAAGAARAEVFGIGAFAGLREETQFSVVSSEFTNPGEIASECTVTYSAASGGAATFSGEVTLFGDGAVHTVKLYLGTDPENLVMADSADVLGAGGFALSGQWPQCGVPNYYQLRYETSDGEETYVSSTDLASMTPMCRATYRWKNTVSEGYWTNAANWTVSGENVEHPCRYPMSEAYHPVVFPSGTDAEILIDQDVDCLYMGPAANNVRVRFRGIGETMPTLTAGAVRMNSTSGVRWVYDRLAMRWTNMEGATDSASERIGTGSTLRLENGATVTIEKGYGTTFGVNAGALELVGGSTYTCSKDQSIGYVSGTSILIDDSTLVKRMSSTLNASTLTLAGSHPVLEVRSTFTSSSTDGANIVFKPGIEGFVGPVISAPNNEVFSGSSRVNISVPRSAAVWKSPRRLEFELIHAPHGINRAGITLAEDRREGCGYSYDPPESEKPTSLYFRCSPVGGTIRIQ